MHKHLFIFSPGHWIGQGKLTFNISPSHVRFYTKWVIEKSEGGVIKAQQQIEQEEESEHLYNTLEFSSIAPTSFDITLSNTLLGKISGHGVIEDKTIAWEFRNAKKTEESGAFEGFEVYEIQENGDYMLHGEYLSDNEYRTIIDGRIWKKS